MPSGNGLAKKDATVCDRGSDGFGGRSVTGEHGAVTLLSLSADRP